MKKQLFTLLVIALLFSLGCKKDLKEPLLPVKVTENGIMDFLNCHGFDTTGAVVMDGYAKVEDDILIDLSTIEQLMALPPSNPLLLSEDNLMERQYVNPLTNGLLVSHSNVIQIKYYIDPSVANIYNVGSSWVTAIRAACNDWTGISNCRVKLTEVEYHASANISFFSDSNVSTIPYGLQNLPTTDQGTTIARACFPNYGLPGRFISINDATTLESMTLAKRKHTIRHEIGHTLGLRHNDSSGESSGTDACGTSYSEAFLLPGTPVNDILSVMRQGALTLNFSHYDSLTAQLLYPQSYTQPNITSATATPGYVTLQAAANQVPYGILIGRYSTTNTLEQQYNYVYPNTQGDTFKLSCPNGTWRFRLQYINYGSYKSALSNSVTKTVNFYSLQSVNYSSKYWQPINWLGYINFANTATEKATSTFNYVPALNGQAGYYSFESKSNPGYYFVNDNLRIKLLPFQNTTAFKNAASFKPYSGLWNSSARSFEPYGYPNYFIRHRQWELWADPFENTDLYKMDATFYLAPPLSL